MSVALHLLASRCVDTIDTVEFIVSTSRLLPSLLPSLLLAGVVFAGASADAASGDRAGWTLEPGTAEPSYATIEPASTDMNIDTVVVVCEAGDQGRLLQLQLYLTEEGLLAPVNAQAARTKDDPKAELSIDGETFPVALLFSESYAVLADDQDGPFAKLSDRLLSAMQTGRTMTLRFDLLADRPPDRSFDGEAVVDLQRPHKAEAIAAMRHCASRTDAASHGDESVPRPSAAQ